MSHSIESLQRMSDAQLLQIARHGQWQIDRTRANEILQQRRRATAASYDARTQTLISSLQNQVNSLTSTNASLANQINAARNQITQMQRTQTQQISSMRADFDNRIKESDRKHQERLTQLARQSQQDMKELRRYFDTEMAQNMQRVTNQISETRDYLNARIDETAAALQGQIQDIQTEVSNIRTVIEATHQTQAQMLQQARDYREAVQGVLAAIDEFNVHNWRSEDRVDINSHYNTLVASLNNGLAGASVAQNNGLALLEEVLIYQRRVLADEQQWQIRMAMADEAVAQTEALLETSRKIPVRTSEGETEVDVDYWTCGDLRRIEDGLAEIRNRMEDPALTVQQLQALQELAMTYRGQIDQSVNYAVQAFQLSRARRQLMDHAVSILTDPVKGNRLRLQWSEYFNGDQRLGYRAYLVGTDGTRVVITAELTNPDGDNPGNVFRSEILEYGTHIHNAQQAAAYNDALLSRLREGTRAEFGTPQCTERESVIPDVGQGNQVDWVRPDQGRVDQAVGQVGYQPSAGIQAQIRTQRSEAGLKV